MIRRDNQARAGSHEPKRVHAVALALVARRELSTAQLRTRLAERGFSSDAIDATIERLLSDGALDDGRTARTLARSEARKHRGPLRIRQALERAGMPRALVREAIAEVMTDVPEPEAVARAFNLRRRQRGLDLSKPADFQRARAYLLRQGFSEAAVGDFLRPLRRRLAETRADDET